MITLLNRGGEGGAQRAVDYAVTVRSLDIEPTLDSDGDGVVDIEDPDSAYTKSIAELRERTKDFLAATEVFSSASSDELNDIWKLCLSNFLRRQFYN